MAVLVLKYVGNARWGLHLFPLQHGQGAFDLIVLVVLVLDIIINTADLLLMASKGQQEVLGKNMYAQTYFLQGINELAQRFVRTIFHLVPMERPQICICRFCRAAISNCPCEASDRGHQLSLTVFC